MNDTTVAIGVLSSLLANLKAKKEEIDAKIRATTDSLAMLKGARIHGGYANVQGAAEGIGAAPHAALDGMTIPSIIYRGENARTILRYMQHNDGHLNIEIFRTEFRNKMKPTYLKTSIYGTLRKMVDAGLVERCNVGDWQLTETGKTLANPAEMRKSHRTAAPVDLATVLTAPVRNFDLNKLNGATQAAGIRLIAEHAGPVGSRLLDVAHIFAAAGLTASVPQVATAGIVALIQRDGGYEKIGPGYYRLKKGKEKYGNDTVQ